MLTRLHTAFHVAVVALLFFSLVQAQNLGGWASSTSVTGVELVRVEQFGTSPSGTRHMSFTLKNVSERDLSAIVVISPDGVTHSIDFFGEGHLAPGDVYVLRIGTTEGNRLLRIVAAAYIDGSFEGSSQPIAFLRAKRLGRALETKRLSDIYATVDPEEIERLGTVSLVTRVGRLPDTAGEAITSVGNVRLANATTDDLRGAGPESRFAFLAGVRLERENALREIGQLAEALAKPTPAAEGLSASEVRDRFVSIQRQRFSAICLKQQQELEVMK
ncbi:MAG: hypothetical protein KJZ70_18950 [Bryobacterales bacterium]|nr:hypothetical protein [Bryobacterales bacterium]